MRTLNSKAGSLVSTNKRAIDIEDKQPCWYADIERGAKRKDYKWKIGCNHDGNAEEYSFKISKAGDVDDDEFWARATGVDFATELIDLFREGGQKAIKDWVKNGCQ